AVVTAEDQSGLVNATSKRRSLYLQVRRSHPETMLASFDAPVLSPNCDRRISSNAPTQALVLMNGDFMRAQSIQLAKRVRAEVSANREALLAAKPFEAASVLPASSWSYGWSALTPAGLVERFKPLAHWTGGQWQGGPALPDPSIGWVLLNASGGHPGNKAHAAVRRLLVPATGTLELTGTLKHGSANGDGVRARVIAPGCRGRQTVSGTWQVKNGATATRWTGPVLKGNVVDCVVDCLETETSDGFEWTLTGTIKSEDGRVLARLDSAVDFAGPAGPSLVAQAAHAIELIHGRLPREGELALLVEFMGRQATRLAGAVPRPALEESLLTLVCQQLLSTNEFLYVD
ncbi:MAG: DUF1553 domain-containing protein, partial [Gemmataceae bacterium]